MDWGLVVQRIRVCVADDYVDEATVLCEGLRLYDYDAIATHNGQDTLDVCFGGGIDILLLDIGLPDIDGYEVCRRLKANPATRDISIIFVTARGHSDDVQKGYALGAVDYIPKPYNLPMVMVRVNSAARTRQTLVSFSFLSDSLVDNYYTDALTGLRNGRFLMERLQEEVDGAGRYNHSLSCLMAELDDPQALDQQLGSAPVDDLLAEVGMVIRNMSRSFDILARYDTFLFAVVLPHADRRDVVGYAQKMQQVVTKTIFSDPPTRVKLTIGTVSSTNGAAQGADQMLGAAMQSLLQAKSQPGLGIVARTITPPDSGE